MGHELAPSADRVGIETVGGARRQFILDRLPRSYAIGAIVKLLGDGALIKDGWILPTRALNGRIEGRAGDGQEFPRENVARISQESLIQASDDCALLGNKFIRNRGMG